MVRMTSLRCVVIAGLMAAVAVSAQQRVERGAEPAQESRGQTVTLMPDGRWLVLGGAGTESRAALWDPNRRSASAATPLRQGRAWHSATLLGDGTVLVIGGLDSQGRPVASAERIDVTASASEPLPSLNWRARAAHTATLVDSAHIVLAGGVVDGEAVGDVDLLDLDQWQVTRLGSLGIARA
jgi:hypothetical protein